EPGHELHVVSRQHPTGRVLRRVHDQHASPVADQRGQLVQVHPKAALLPQPHRDRRGSDEVHERPVDRVPGVRVDHLLARLDQGQQREEQDVLGAGHQDDLVRDGHEDHIGALPWILSELNVPVWGTEFTLAYVEDKLEEHGLLDSADLREIRPGQSFKVGSLTIHPIQVTHSLVDCVSLAIHTPLGVVLHTGDFKVDPTPTDNRLFDLHAFAEYGKEGVLALFQDSTNVERKGYTPSERAVRRKFDEVFARTRRRLFISCFSSSIHRIKLAIELAWQHGRKVAFIGRSMNSSAEIAEDLGYIEIPDGVLIHPGEMKNFAPEKVCVLISGTQGEPMSALSRAAVDTHKHAKIEKGDTVMLSSRIIPGNEKAIYRMIDHLFRREAHVIYEDGSSPPVH